MRADLLQLDPIDGADRARYDAALRWLFERRLSRRGQLLYLLPTIGGLVVALAMTSLAVSEPPSTPLQTRVLLLALAGIGAFWFVACGKILARGSVNLRGDRRRIVSTALVVSTLQAAFFGWRSQADSSALPGLVLSLVFVVIAAALFVAQHVRESELRIREQLLRARLDAPR